LDLKNDIKHIIKAILETFKTENKGSIKTQKINSKRNQNGKKVELFQLKANFIIKLRRRRIEIREQLLSIGVTLELKQIASNFTISQIAQAVEQ
jgi:spore coat protein CotH